MSAALRTTGTFLLGAAVGLGLGWTVFRRPAERAGPAPEEATSEGREPPAAPALAPAPLGPPAEAPHEPPLLETVRSGTPGEIGRAFPRSVERRVPAEAVPLLVTRLDQAVAAGDQALFDVAASLLADSAHPDAVRAFARLTMDPAADLPNDAGRWFGPALATVRIPGLAAAARRRHEAAIRSGRTWITDAWLEAVAGSGDADDLEWIVRRSDPRDGLLPIARSTNPLAVERFRQGLWKDDGMRGLADHLERNPDGWPWALEIAAGEIAGDPARSGEGLKHLLTTLARNAPETEIPRVRDLLLGIRDARQVLQALPAVQSLARRGVEVAPFEAMVQAPRLALEAIARGSEESWQGISIDTLVYAVEYNRVTWSEPTARALEALADRPNGGAHAAKVAEKVRAALASRWKER